MMTVYNVLKDLKNPMKPLPLQLEGILFQRPRPNLSSINTSISLVGHYQGSSVSMRFMLIIPLRGIMFVFFLTMIPGTLLICSPPEKKIISLTIFPLFHVQNGSKSNLSA